MNGHALHFAERGASAADVRWEGCWIMDSGLPWRWAALDWDWARCSVTQSYLLARSAFKFIPRQELPFPQSSCSSLLIIFLCLLHFMSVSIPSLLLSLNVNLPSKSSYWPTESPKWTEPKIRQYTSEKLMIYWDDIHIQERLWQPQSWDTKSRVSVRLNNLCLCVNL